MRNVPPRLAPPAVKNIGIEGRLVPDGVRKALANRRTVIENLIKAIGEYRKSDGDHQAVHALNKALERAASISLEARGHL
jgi:hypothetical protein